MPTAKRDIRDLSYEELTAFLDPLGEPQYRVDQIFDWLYKKNVRDFSQMSNLSQALREELAKVFSCTELKVVERHVAVDGTAKFLFGLHDDERVETVLIPTPDRATVCVSTQAGCKFRCQFCASGIAGWDRNLSCGEIVGQILYARDQSPEQTLSNIVFMGVGEPLDNYDNLIKAIRILNDERGPSIGARRITISTCGLVPQIKKLAAENLQVELAVSLHGSNNEIRSQLMPVNKKYPLPELVQACRDYIQLTNRQVTFEYILIKNLTCTEQAANELGELLKGMICRVNLIPYNRVEEYPHETPSKMEILLFQDKLTRLGVHSTVRTPRGRDAAAACGQLRHARRQKL